jgi:hypothetical protein
LVNILPFRTFKLGYDVSQAFLFFYLSALLFVSRLFLLPLTSFVTFLFLLPFRTVWHASLFTYVGPSKHAHRGGEKTRSTDDDCDDTGSSIIAKSIATIADAAPTSSIATSEGVGSGGDVGVGVSDRQHSRRVQYFKRE